ncbi:MAG: phosphatidate cytidylyltransferase [Lachnospiraceae bacterium]|nr:phosphatidate cytidylyltransferase [Lachnospiraceae bacterium]
MKVRIISGVTFALLMAFVVWLGDAVLAIAWCAVSIIAYIEMANATNVSEIDAEGKRKLNLIETISIAGIVIYYVMIYVTQDPLYEFMTMVFLLILTMVVYVFTFPKYKAEQIMHSFFAFIYGPVMISFSLMTRMMNNGTDDTSLYNVGFFAAWMIFISAWASDTCAYFVGVTLGKHKLAPTLSPKKSIEGAIGGVLGATIAGGIYGKILEYYGIFTDGGIWIFALLGMCGSIVAQIGDLAASAIKRNFDIKDYGKCIPGHGGVLDRFDSVIFTSPLIYVLALYFLG